MSLVWPYLLGIVAAELTEPEPSICVGAALAGLPLLVRRDRLARIGEGLLAAAIGSLALSLRLHAPIPSPPGSPVLVTLLSPPELRTYGCRLLMWIHGESPGRAVLEGADPACTWLPGQRAVGIVEVGPLRPPTNPGASDTRRRWARRGVHRRGRIVEGRIAALDATPEGPRVATERLRRRISDGLDPGAGSRGGSLLRAIVVGDRSRLVGEVRGPFERSGTAHLLAVSGLHVGWVFALGRALLLGLLHPIPSVRAQRRRRSAAISAGLVAAGGYAVLAGLSVPTLRAIVMAAAGAAALTGGRPGSTWNALAAAALVVTVVDPGSLFDPGFALSFSAVAGLVLWRPSGGHVRRLAGATFAASLSTGPVAALAGLPVAMLALLANLLLVPWFGLVVLPLGLVTALLAAGGLAAGVQPLAEAAAELGLRSAFRLQSPDLAGAVDARLLAALACVGFAIRSSASGRPRVARVLGSAAAALLLVMLTARTHEGTRSGFEALFLDVGHGDATLLRSGASAGLVDAGPRIGTFDAGRVIVAPALRAEGVRELDLLVLTHADRDHVGGALSVVERVPPREIWVPLATLDDPEIRDLRARAAALRIPIRLPFAGHERQIARARVRVLWPRRGRDPTARNEGGLVLRVDVAGACMMLPADVPARVERLLVREGASCDVLKLSHHGSGTGTHADWLSSLSPGVAVASASVWRRHLFPSADVRRRLVRAHVTLYESGCHGAIRIRLEPAPLLASPWLDESACPR